MLKYKDIVDGQEKLDTIIRHCENVRNNCQILGEELLKKNEEEFAIKIISNGRIHDISKFNGIEFQYLNSESKEKTPELFEVAFEQHVQNNPHHPEYYTGGINDMPEVYLAEMTVDWIARSTEFSTDFFEWVKEKATEKYKFTTCGRIFKTIKKYAELIITPKFK